MNRETCPDCGGDTEFVEHGGADSDVVETTPEDVGDGLLELRTCLNCHAGLEYVLEPTSVTVVPFEDGENDE